MSPATLHESAHTILNRFASALFALTLLSTACGVARAQAIGANRGEAVTNGGRAIQGHIISPAGKLPDSRIRITLDSSNESGRTAIADQDGNFTFNGLEAGPYNLTIDAGKEFEVAHESVYIEGGKPIYLVPIYLVMKPEANPALAGIAKPAVDLFVKAVESERKGDPEKAAALLAEAVSQQPGFGLAHNELGLIYMRTGQLDKAVAEYKAASASLPEDASVQLNYGTALTQKKEFAEAEKHLRHALKTFDKSAPAHLYLGLSLIGLKDIDGAEKELQQAVKFGEQTGTAHKYLGGIYWKRGEYKKAADELETYLKLSPKAADADQIRGTIKELRAKS